MILIDLVGIVRLTTVANKDRTSNFLVKHDTHFGLQPSNDIQIGDVDNIIAIKLLLLVDGRRSGHSLQQLDDLILLHAALDVTLGASLVSSDVGNYRLDARKWRMLGLAQNIRNPLHPTRDHLGAVGNGLRIREEELDIIDAVITSVREERLLERAETRSVAHDLLELAV